MSDNRQANNTQAPPVLRGRGRGNPRGAGRGAGTLGSFGRASAPKTGLGPNKVLEFDYKKDSSLKDSFVIVLAGESLPVQITFHHPIGETELDPRAWVATPTHDIGYLIQRKTSPEILGWERRVAQRIREGVLADSIGRTTTVVNGRNVEQWDEVPNLNCKEEILRLQTVAKAAGDNDSNWLNHASQAIKAAENTFKAALVEDARRAAAIEHAGAKPRHVTMGGPMGTTPQTAVRYLAYVATPTARDKVVKQLLGIEVPSIQAAATAAPNVASSSSSGGT